MLHRCFDDRPTIPPESSLATSGVPGVPPPPLIWVQVLSPKSTNRLFANLVGGLPMSFSLNAHVLHQLNS